MQNYDHVRDTLEKAGLLINFEKSALQPVQCLEWLGLTWNSTPFSLSIPPRRVNDAVVSIKFLIDKFSLFTARKLARAAVKIIAMYPVVGNVASLMTRQIYLAIENRICWDRLLLLSFPEAVKKLFILARLSTQT